MICFFSRNRESSTQARNTKSVSRKRWRQKVGFLDWIPSWQNPQHHPRCYIVYCDSHSFFTFGLCVFLLQVRAGFQNRKCKSGRLYKDLYKLNKPSFCSGSCDEIQATIKLQKLHWNILENSWNFIWNILGTHLSLSVNTLKTFLKHPWNFLLQTPFKLSWNTIETL